MKPLSEIVPKIGDKRGYRLDDNSSLPLKLALRKRILTMLRADKVNVLDAFCGEGAIHAGLWKAKADTYLGLDNTKLHRNGTTELVADSRSWVTNKSLAEFNLFDFDAYSNPWEILFLATRNKSFGSKHPRVGVVLTDGGLLAGKMSGSTKLQQALMQIPSKMKIPGLHRHMEFFMALSVRRAGEAAGMRLAGPILFGFSRQPSNTVYAGFVYMKTS